MDFVGELNPEGGTDGWWDTRLVEIAGVDGYLDPVSQRFSNDTTRALDYVKEPVRRLYLARS